MEKRKLLEDAVARAIGATDAVVEADEAKFFESGNWGNVTGHCLMEAARAAAFADILKFDASLKEDFVLAALLHDGYKRHEVEAIQEAQKNGESGRAASNAATARYLLELREKKVPDRTIRIVGFAGGMPEVLIACKNILDKKLLSDEDLASLLMYYIDAYTINDEWVGPAVSDKGHTINEIDRRSQKNKDNQNYKKIDEEAAGILRGNSFFKNCASSFEAMALVGHAIEKKFSEIIKEKSGKAPEPVNIPEMIDGYIK